MDFFRLAMAYSFLVFFGGLTYVHRQRRLETAVAYRSVSNGAIADPQDFPFIPRWGPKYTQDQLCDACCHLVDRRYRQGFFCIRHYERAMSFAKLLWWPLSSMQSTSRYSLLKGVRLSVRMSVRHHPVLYQSGLTYPRNS